MSKNNNLHSKALFLEYITIGWNILEGLGSMILGAMSGSVSLFAYGLESSIEVFSSSVAVWGLRSRDKDREEKALKLIGIAYLAVSAYVFVDASKSLLENHHPEPTQLGIVFMVVTALVMLVLGLLKRDVGNKLSNPVVLADAKFTLIDAALSCTVLVGLVLNTLWGWWWTDQALALFLAGTAFREGLKEIL